MKFKSLGTAVLAALALLTLVSSASATTFEVKGVKKNEALTIQASLKIGTSVLLSDTFGGFANTCTSSQFTWVIWGPYTTVTLEGSTHLVSFSSCKEERVVIDEQGEMYLTNIGGTTNGTMSWRNYKITTPSPYGALTCVSGTSRDIGTLTGVSSGNATLDVNATLNCGIITAKWTGTYSITSPEGLGVTS
jgi:hypothetical protein